MNIHDNKEHQLEQLEGVLSIFTYIQPGNDSSESCYSEDFKQTKHGQILVVRLSEKEKQVVKWYSGEYIDWKTTF